MHVSSWLYLTIQFANTHFSIVSIRSWSRLFLRFLLFSLGSANQSSVLSDSSNYSLSVCLRPHLNMYFTVFTVVLILCMTSSCKPEQNKKPSLKFSNFPKSPITPLSSGVRSGRLNIYYPEVCTQLDARSESPLVPAAAHLTTFDVPVCEINFR